jgi:hypothetical protein
MYRFPNDFKMELFSYLGTASSPIFWYRVQASRRNAQRSGAAVKSILLNARVEVCNPDQLQSPRSCFARRVLEYFIKVSSRIPSNVWKNAILTSIVLFIYLFIFIFFIFFFLYARYTGVPQFCSHRVKTCQFHMAQGRAAHLSRISIQSPRRALRDNV